MGRPPIAHRLRLDHKLVVLQAERDRGGIDPHLTMIRIAAVATTITATVVLVAAIIAIPTETGDEEAMGLEAIGPLVHPAPRHHRSPRHQRIL